MWCSVHLATGPLTLGALSHHMRNPTRWPYCEEAKPHGKDHVWGRLQSAVPSWVILAQKPDMCVNELSNNPRPQPTAFESFQGVLQACEPETTCSTVSCLNSCSTDSVHIIKWFFQVSGFYGNAATDKRNTGKPGEAKAKSEPNPGLLILGLALLPLPLFCWDFCIKQSIPVPHTTYYTLVNKVGAERSLAKTSSCAQGRSRSFHCPWDSSNLPEDQPMESICSWGTAEAGYLGFQIEKNICTSQQSLTFTGPVICSQV